MPDEMEGPAPTTGGALITDAQPAIPPEQQARAEGMPAGPPERSPYGIAPPDDVMGFRAIRAQLDDLPFPMSKAEILARAGAWRVPVTGAHYHPLAQFLEGLPERRYRSVDALLRALARARPELKP